METESLHSTDEDSAALVLSWHQAMLEDRPVSTLDAAAANPRLGRIHDCLHLLDRLRRGQNRIVDPPSDETRMFGKFVILNVLGKGGQGIVYKARDTALGRIVALKAPNPETLESPELRQRLIRESQTAARLNHPNLVPVYEVGEVGPAFFIASQFCDGPTLAQWLNEHDQPINLRQAAEIIFQLAEATHYVHGFGVLHRDIKPGNVLLDSRPASVVENAPRPHQIDFTPRLTDFGLAKLHDGSQLKTHTGAVLGTPAYMAPEQAEGRTHQFGPSMDVYALGAVLYELLTGRRPFTGQNDVEVLQKVCRGNPPSLRSLRRDTPRDLEAICLKCLEYEPRRRYQSAGELAHDLDRYLAGEHVRARRSGFIDRLFKWRRRQPLIASLSALLLLSLVVGMATAAWQWRQSEQARAQAEDNFAQAHGAVGRLHNLLLESDEYDHPRFNGIKRQMLQSAVIYYEQMLDQRANDLTLMANLADACTHLAAVQRATGATDEARRLYQRALPLWERLVRDEPENIDHTYFLAKVHLLRGMLEQSANPSVALEHHETALQLREALVQRQPRRLSWKDPLAQSCHNLASLYAKLGRKAEAQAMIRRAISLREELARMQPDTPHRLRQLAECYSTRAHLYTADQQYERAIALCHKGSEIAETLVKQGRESPHAEKTLASLRSQEARVRHMMGGRPEAALAFTEQAIELLEPLVRRHPDMPTYSHRLVAEYAERIKLLLALERKEEARAAYEKAISLDQRLAKTDPAARIRIANFELALGHLYYSGQLPKAREHFDQAWLAVEQLRDHIPDVQRQELAGVIAGWLGAALEPMNKLDEAALWRRRAIELEEGLRKQRNNDQNVRQRLANNYYALGYVEERRGRFREAQQNYQAAHRCWKTLAALSPDSSQYEQSCNNAARSIDRVRDEASR